MDNFRRARPESVTMWRVDDLVWDRCPDCLGLLDAVEVVGGVALGCRECGYLAEITPLEMPPRPAAGDALPGLHRF